MTVPAVSITSGGKTLRSSAATFSILPPRQPASAAGTARAVAEEQQTYPGGAHRQAGQVSSDDLLVRVFFSKNTVYEQEPVVATIKVYTKYDISSFLPTVQPAFEGFLDRRGCL